jgi:hypothetical protein
MRRHISLITIFIGVLIIFYETRHFYKIGDRTLTIWKTNSGCFVIPYSYYGILPPQKNYLKLSNIGTAYIFLVPKDSLYIFVEPYSDGYSELSNHMYSSKLITYSAATSSALKQSKLWVDSFDKYKKLYPFISVEARYMDILIKEK